MTIHKDWKRIALVFSVLVALLLGNFSWQVHRINKSFREHSLTHSRVLGAVVELNIRNAMMSHRGMESIMGNALENSARFVRYLNQVEPFAARELEAFAAESGLTGITVFSRDDRVPTMGPLGWLDRSPAQFPDGLTFLPRAHLYVYLLPPLSGSPADRENDGVMVGMSAGPVEKVQETLSVERLLGLLNQMQGIEYVRLEKRKNDALTQGAPVTKLINIKGKPLSETRVIMGEQTLIVGLEADYFSGRMAALKKELMGFIALLVLLGLMASWWLYTVQRQQLEQTRIFERKMAHQLEQASLGRAAATITHEMRNPLNAISMGLQRLQMETGGLEQDHCDLVASMRQAVERSNAVISRLQQYVQPFEPGHETIRVSRLMESLAVLYGPQCADNGIDLDLQLDSSAVVKGDTHYLSQVFENLMKNAVEAQPDGGFLNITLVKKGKNCIIGFENSCGALTLQEKNKILEPYFTTKTHGTGLGLVISKKIVAAHAGQLEAMLQGERFCVHVTLPLIPENVG